MKLLWIGMDGLDSYWVKRWLKKLPELKHLTKKSAWGQLTPEIPFSPQSWTTIFSGYNAATHGIFDLANHNMTVDSHVPMFWQAATSAGINIGVYRVPMTFPPEVVKGWMYSGWSAPYPACYPNTPDYQENLVNVLSCDAEANIYHTPQAAIQHVAIYEQEVEQLYKILEKHPVDVLVAVFCVLDKVGHNIWEVHWDKEEAQDDRLNWYKRVDRDMGKLIQHCNPETLVINSDHGFNSRELSNTVWNPSHLGELPVWHTKEGFYLIKGPRVKPQELEMSNLDLLPTVMKAIVWNPTYKMDGKVAPIFGDTYTKEEQEIVEARLKGLGYM